MHGVTYGASQTFGKDCEHLSYFSTYFFLFKGHPVLMYLSLIKHLEPWVALKKAIAEALKRSRPTSLYETYFILTSKLAYANRAASLSHCNILYRIQICCTTTRGTSGCASALAKLCAAPFAKWSPIRRTLITHSTSIPTRRKCLRGFARSRIL